MYGSAVVASLWLSQALAAAVSATVSVPDNTVSEFKPQYTVRYSPVDYFRRDDSDSTESTGSDSDNTESSESEDTNTSSDDKSDDSSDSSASKTTSINANLPAGQVMLVTPTSTASTYIKAGDYATFKWSFTNVLVSPSAVNVEAHCSANQQTYTLASNQPINDTKLVWNTSDVSETADVGLMTAQYTLYIYDSNSTYNSAGGAGKLSPMTYIFGVYLPQKYTTWPQAGDYVNVADRQTVMTVVVGAAVLFVCCFSL